VELSAALPVDWLFRVERPPDAAQSERLALTPAVAERDALVSGLQELQDLLAGRHRA
jgi:hypothetical protein